uniref:Secreted protein n=1 Tax=Steinernema glaseri TaxID=37863 RepID=A0A1I8ASW5_9BILA
MQTSCQIRLRALTCMIRRVARRSEGPITLCLLVVVTVAQRPITGGRWSAQGHAGDRYRSRRLFVSAQVMMWYCCGVVDGGKNWIV